MIEKLKDFGVSLRTQSMSSIKRSMRRLYNLNFINSIKNLLFLNINNR